MLGVGWGGKKAEAPWAHFLCSQVSTWNLMGQTLKPCRHHHLQKVE